MYTSSKHAIPTESGRDSRLAVLLVFCALASCLFAVSKTMGNTTAEMPADMRRIMDRGELIIAVHADEGAPFYTLNKKGELEGIDIDLAKSMAASLDVKVRFDRQASTFDGLIDVVASGKVDLAISCVSRTPRRATRVNFSQPYVRLHHALLVNRVMSQRAGGNRHVSDWLNQSDVKIGTIAGSSYMDFAVKDYPAATLIGFESFDDAAAATVRGELHAVIFDNSLISLWVDAHPEEVLYVQTRILYDKEDPICVVVNWRDTHLLNWVETYLMTLEADGRLPAMRQKWLGDK